MMNRRWMLKLLGLGALAAPVAAEAALPERQDVVRLVRGEIPQSCPSLESDDRQLVYRTTGEWGQGAERMLTAQEVDRNFWLLEQRIREMGI